MKIGIFDHVSLGLGGSQAVIALMATRLSQAHEVDVIHSGRGYTLSNLAKAFEVDLCGVNERVLEDGVESFAQPIRAYIPRGLRADRALTGPYDLFIYSGHGIPPFSYARHGIIYCHFPLEGNPADYLQSNECWQKRYAIDRWARLAVYRAFWMRRMRGYETLLGNSQFTAGWIKRLWGREAAILYPPVDVRVPQVEKHDVIVSVGNFMSSDLKGHAQQLKAFREFISRTHGRWSMRMIGFCCDIAEDLAYLRRLQHMSQDLPVTFVVNAERKVVLRSLAEAKLFWHTTGIGNQGHAEPRRTEHFGIATVEAMMAGCVPVVPACGGQPEIVEHRLSGFLCEDLDALIRHSVSLAKDDLLCSQMSRRALELSRKFRPALFEQRLDELVVKSLGKHGRRKSPGTCNSLSEASRLT